MKFKNADVYVLTKISAVNKNTNGIPDDGVVARGRAAMLFNGCLMVDTNRGIYRTSPVLTFEQAENGYFF